MTRAEYLDWFRQTFEQMAETTRRKNTDYSGGADDPFTNFRGYEAVGVTMEQGIMTRLVDKHSRACGLVAGHQALVTDEALEDTLRDSIIYTMLLLAVREDRRREAARSEAEAALAPHPNGWVPMAATPHLGAECGGGAM